jgi:L-asparagine oxygenase
MAALSDLNEQMSECGFAVLPRFAPSMDSAEAFASLGSIDVVEGLNPVQTLAPHPSEKAPPNTYSGNFGIAEFPLHTDLAHWATPPRFIALRCLRGVDRVTTRVLDGRMLIERLGINALRMALVQPRRPLRNGKQLLRLLERFGDGDEFAEVGQSLSPAGYMLKPSNLR